MFLMILKYVTFCTIGTVLTCFPAGYISNEYPGCAKSIILGTIYYWIVILIISIQKGLKQEKGK